MQNVFDGSKHYSKRKKHLLVKTVLYLKPGPIYSKPTIIQSNNNLDLSKKCLNSVANLIFKNDLKMTANITPYIRADLCSNFPTKPNYKIKYVNARNKSSKESVINRQLCSTDRLLLRKFRLANENDKSNLLVFNNLQPIISMKQPSKLRKPDMTTLTLLAYQLHCCGIIDKPPYLSFMVVERLYVPTGSCNYMFLDPKSQNFCFKLLAKTWNRHTNQVTLSRGPEIKTDELVANLTRSVSIKDDEKPNVVVLSLPSTQPIIKSDELYLKTAPLKINNIQPTDQDELPQINIKFTKQNSRRRCSGRGSLKLIENETHEQKQMSFSSSLEADVFHTVLNNIKQVITMTSIPWKDNNPIVISKYSGSSSDFNYQLFSDEVMASVSEDSSSADINNSIETVLLLKYSETIINRTLEVTDRSWSGNLVSPYLEHADHLYDGGYGYLDGVLNMRPTRKTEIVIEFQRARESFMALSHMFSLRKLIGKTADLSLFKYKATYSIPLESSTSTTVFSDPSKSEKTSSSLDSFDKRLSEEFLHKSAKSDYNDK